MPENAGQEGAGIKIIFKLRQEKNYSNLTASLSSG
jgi:hypothetical protein